MIFFAFLLFIAGLALLWYSNRQRQATGLPGGRVIYSDTHKWGAVSEPLYDPELGLTGKPDYLVEQGGKIIPVEVKSSPALEGPYDSHIYQVAAYCRLVQRTHGKRPPYGILHYPNRTYAIDYTPALEAALAVILQEIRSQDRADEVDRSHDSAARCSGCGYRAICDQRLRG